MSPRSIRRAHARRIARDQRQALLRRRRELAAGIIGAALLAPGAAQAANLTVMNTNDAGAGSLRDALATANGNGVDDAITFDPSVTGTITLTTGELAITEAHGLTITGPGRDNLTISAGDSSRIFEISANGPTESPVVISGLTLTHGRVTANYDEGGAVWAHGNTPVTLSNLAITDSSATGTHAHGGGVASQGYQTTITASTVSGNSAPWGGGISGLNQNLRVQDSTITGNHSTSSYTNAGGGGIELNQHTVVDHSTISGNTAVSQGGGLWAKYGGTITNSTVTGNTAAEGGGMQLGTNDRKYYANVLVSDTTVSGNTAPKGAGIEVRQVEQGKPVRVERSTISGNNGGDSSFGGGLLVDSGVYGPVELVDSTISGNTATAGAGVSIGSDDGNVFSFTNDGTTPGSIDLDNSTISGNAASAHGGGIYLSHYDDGSPTVTKSATANFTSTIVAGNTAAGAAQDLDRADVSTAGGFNGAFSLVQAPGDAPLAQQSMLIGVDPQLGALADNGGPTKTMLPAGTSPAIDQGRSPTSLKVDQRGLDRLVDSGLANPSGGDGTDIGAVELPAAQVVLPPPPPKATFDVAVRGKSISPGTPLLPASLLPFNCSITVVSMSQCKIELRALKATRISKKSRVAQGSLLAEGIATSAAGATNLAVRVKLTSDGKAVLKAQPVGVDTLVEAAGATGTTEALTEKGAVHLLAGPSVTLGLGNRKAKLAGTVNKRVDQLAKLIPDAKTVTCTAYSDKGKGDVTLTKKQAKAACDRLVKDGIKATVKSSGKGHAKPVASNRTKKGRALNRRIVITFTL